MARWRSIPPKQQKPGKLMGGHWVVLQAWTFSNHWAMAMLGPEGARVTGGYGGWEQTAVPRGKSITEWTSEPNMEMTLDLLFDGWMAHPVIPRLRTSFIGAPKLPTGVQFPGRRGNRPVGMVMKSNTRRPVPPASKPAPSAIKSIRNRPVPPASKPMSGAVGAMKRPVPPASNPPGQLGGAMARPRTRNPGPRNKRPTQLPPPKTRSPPKALVRRAALPAPRTRRPAPVRRRDRARPQGLFIESMLNDLETLASRQPGDQNPHSIRIYGAVPHPEKRWVITGLEWGDCIRDKTTGRRMRQQVTVNLLEYYQPGGMRRLPRGKAGDKPPAAKKSS